VFPHGGDDGAVVDDPIDSGCHASSGVIVRVLLIEPLLCQESFWGFLQLVPVGDGEAAIVRAAGGPESDDIRGGGFLLGSDFVRSGEDFHGVPCEVSEVGVVFWKIVFGVEGEVLSDGEHCGPLGIALSSCLLLWLMIASLI